MCTLRYILAGGLSDSRFSVGGLAAQLNRLSIVIRLAVTENATLPIHYDRELRRHIQRLERSMGAGVGFYPLLSEDNTEIKRQVKTEMEKNRSKTKNTLMHEGRGQGGKPTTQTVNQTQTQVQGKGENSKGNPWWPKQPRQQESSSASDPKGNGEMKGAEVGI